MGLLMVDYQTHFIINRFVYYSKQEIIFRLLSLGFEPKNIL